MIFKIHQLSQVSEINETNNLQRKIIFRRIKMIYTVLIFLITD